MVKTKQTRYFQALQLKNKPTYYKAKKLKKAHTYNTTRKTQEKSGGICPVREKCRVCARKS